MKILINFIISVLVAGLSLSAALATLAAFVAIVAADFMR